MIKALRKIRAILPAGLQARIKRRGRERQAERNRSRPPKDVFSEIYAESRWGSSEDGFYSGAGSRGLPAERYVEMVSSFIAEKGIANVVDLGYGDFQIGRRIAETGTFYTGIDVVHDLIDSHRRTFGNDRIRFVAMDIAADILPAAELCLIWQVLQHMSNAQIANVVTQFDKYKYVVITEHYPSEAYFRTYNKDKVCGGDTRLDDGSAVYLDKPPFNIAGQQLLLEVDAPKNVNGIDDVHSTGSIRSFLLQSSIS